MNKNIILIGYRAAGKTTIGKSLSNYTGMKNYDMDLIIEQETGFSISEIFNKFGEQYFRVRENKTLQKLKNLDNSIISTGGGVVENIENRNTLKRMGLIIWLKTNTAIAYKRLLKNNIIRPPLTKLNLKNEIKNKLNKRNRLYYHLSHKTINTGNKSIKSITMEIIRYYNIFIKK
ncbi:MAG: shikimate kinase [bacterium]